jgi:hypothetical protein
MIVFVALGLLAVADAIGIQFLDASARDPFETVLFHISDGGAVQIRQGQRVSVLVESAGVNVEIKLEVFTNSSTLVYDQTEKFAPFCFPSDCSQSLLSRSDFKPQSVFNVPLRFVVTESVSGSGQLLSTSVFSVFLSSSTSTFSVVSSGVFNNLSPSPNSTQATNATGGLVVFDCNNDGRDDVALVHNGALHLCVNQRAGTIPPFQCAPMAFNVSGSVAIGRRNAESFSDLIVASSSGTFELRNPGTNSCFVGTSPWVSHAAFPNSAGSTSRFLMDVDADGDLDWVSPGTNSTWFEWTGTAFEPRASLPGGRTGFNLVNEGATAAYLNGNGQLDIVARSNNTIFTFLSTANGQTGAIVYSSSSGPVSGDSPFPGVDWAWVVCDLNPPITNDFFLVARGQGVRGLYRDGVQAAPQNFSEFLTAATWLDANGDRKPDLFLTDDTGALLYMSACSPTSSAPVLSRRFDGVIAMDVDGDGDEDVLASSRGALTVFYSQVNPAAWIRVRVEANSGLPTGCRIRISETRKPQSNVAFFHAIVPTSGRNVASMSPTFVLNADTRYNVYVIFPRSDNTAEQRTRALGWVIGTHRHHVVISESDPAVSFATEPPTIVLNATSFVTGAPGSNFNFPRGWAEIVWPASEHSSTDKVSINLTVSAGILSSGEHRGSEVVVRGELDEVATVLGNLQWTVGGTNATVLRIFLSDEDIGQEDNSSSLRRTLLLSREDISVLLLPPGIATTTSATTTSATTMSATTTSAASTSATTSATSTSATSTSATKTAGATQSATLITSQTSPVLTTVAANDTNVGGIIGGVVGGAIGLALLCGIVFFLRARQKGKQPQPAADVGMKASATSEYASFASFRVEKEGDADYGGSALATLN